MKFNYPKKLVRLLTVGIVALLVAACQQPENRLPQVAVKTGNDSAWVAPSIQKDTSLAPEAKKLLLYGETLIAHTAAFFGPKGSITHTSNGMNCQNCHLEAGRKSWGINFGAVAANYPRYNPRGANTQSIYGRINDCFERSLDGKKLDTATKEMQAMFAYIHWLGQKVPPKKKPYGSGMEKIAFINRAADPYSGRLVYIAKCMVCHGKNGGGLLAPNGVEYTYPPLWGPNSYNNGAGLYRLSGFAGFVKNNMPYLQASHAAPVLSTEQAWDVAAYVNSQPRPVYDQSKDWKDVTLKPVDFPFGPYADTFTQQQHRYGPFAAIAAAKK